MDLEKDAKRREKLELLGYNFLQFLDSDIKGGIDAVLECITDWIEKFESDNPRLKPPP